MPANQCTVIHSVVSYYETGKENLCIAAAARFITGCMIRKALFLMDFRPQGHLRFPFGVTRRAASQASSRSPATFHILSPRSGRRSKEGVASKMPLMYMMYVF